MAIFKLNDIINALTVLSKVTAGTHRKISEYSVERALLESDEYNDSNCRVFDSFYNERSGPGAGSLIYFSHFKKHDGG